ncbi:MAG: Spy/CpxP family protein refolding chaperone [Thermoanaerobaculales bacterium]|nr:Spy/CpxP family protein refolding chaperone [Thermoanaerobaculales bacterium]
MRVRNIILTIAAAALIAVPLTLVAQGVPGGGNGQGPGGGPGGGVWGHGPQGGGNGFEHGLGFIERMLPRLAEELGLTNEQLQEIQAIVDEERPKIEELSAKMRALHETRRESHDPAVFDEGEVRSFAAELAPIQADLMVAGERTRAKALQVLTEEQLQQLEEMRGDFGKRFTRRSGGRRTQ